MATPAPASASEPPDEVVRLAARAHERDRYLAALLSPKSARRDLIALAAFAGEIGRIPLFVGEAMMARIRLQWWRERLAEGTSGGHPVAAAIIETATRRGLDATRLAGLIDAHDDGLDDRPIADQAALLAHVDRIDGALFALATALCGSTPDAALARAAGRAYGLARLVHELPAALAHGRLLLPLPKSAPLPASADQLAPLLATTAATARAELAGCTAPLRQLTRAGRSPYLPVALVEPYLQVLEQVRQQSRQPVEVDPFKRTWKLWRCRWTGKVD